MDALDGVLLDVLGEDPGVLQEVPVAGRALAGGQDRADVSEPGRVLGDDLVMLGHPAIQLPAIEVVADGCLEHGPLDAGVVHVLDGLGHPGLGGARLLADLGEGAHHPQPHRVVLPR